MPALEPTVYDVKGKDGKLYKFTVKETTMRNRDFLHTKLGEYQQQVQDAASELLDNLDIENMTMDEINEVKVTNFDKYLLDFEMFCWLTEGPHDQLVPEDFNVKLTDAARTAFLSDSGTITDVLLRSLGS